MSFACYADVYNLKFKYNPWLLSPSQNPDRANNIGKWTLAYFQPTPLFILLFKDLMSVGSGLHKIE